MKISGLWTPLVTPLYHGAFDSVSMIRLIESIDRHNDGYVVGLSSGEGPYLSPNLWQQAVTCAVDATAHPVAAGIFSSNIDEIRHISLIAAKLGCKALAIPSAGKTNEEICSFFESLNRIIELPIIIYNTETCPIKDVSIVQRLDHLESIIAIKDSSGDETFYHALIDAKFSLKLSVFQGLEHKLLAANGSDGFMLSLGNIEPELCQKMLLHSSVALNKQVLDKFWEYNLGGEWYISLKALLYSKGILRSAEQVMQTLTP